LEFKDLLVLKRAPVVDDLHRVFGAANLARTLGWLTNLASVEADVDGVIANIATEKGILHVRNDGCCPNDKALDRNQAVHIYRKHVSTGSTASC
jgi:hypothetical protein